MISGSFSSLLEIVVFVVFCCSYHVVVYRPSDVRVHAVHVTINNLGQATVCVCVCVCECGCLGAGLL